MLIIEIYYNLLYVWNCIKLCGKEFFLNGNCMIRSFGQHGKYDFTISYGETSFKAYCQRHFDFKLFFFSLIS